MVFNELDIRGAFLVEVDARSDHRGFFARTFCQREFAEHGIAVCIAQSSISLSKRRGTVRGLHFQRSPSRETKLVRCERGAVFDVIVDLRPSSATYTRHVALELDENNHRAVYVPPGVAHGFQTLENDTEVLYCMGDYFEPDLATGVRWNDPAFGIRWPIQDVTIVDRDASYADFDARQFASTSRAP
jgi:dTDP-4-dehydrorhamnose 3,5-epimerase